jgi:CRP-like cAMP-binding protein
LSESSAERIKLLSLVDIFEPLSEEEIERLNDQLPDRHLENGEIFYGPDDPSERLFILRKGKVRIYRTTPDGREFTLAVVESSSVFGEMALTGQQLEGAYAQAMEASLICTMAREDLERLVLEKPEVGLKIMQVLSERLRRYETRLEDANMKDVHARLADIIVLLVESEGVRNGTGYRIHPVMRSAKLAPPFAYCAALMAEVDVLVEEETQRKMVLSQGGLRRQEGKPLEYCSAAEDVQPRFSPCY